MTFQGKEFTPEMKQLVVNVKTPFDKEKKAGKTVSTRNATRRVAQGLGIGEATVKRIMAANTHGQLTEVTEKARGKPPYRLSCNGQPVIREFIRQKNLKGQKIDAEQIRAYLLHKHAVEIPMSTFLKALTRLGGTYGTGQRRSTQFTWYLEEDGPWGNKPSGKGLRRIVVHAITMRGVGGECAVGVCSKSTDRGLSRSNELGELLEMV